MSIDEAPTYSESKHDMVLMAMPTNMTDILNLLRLSVIPPEWMTLTNVVQFMAVATTFFGVAAAVMQLFTALFRKIEVSFESTVENVPLTDEDKQYGDLVQINEPNPLNDLPDKLAFQVAIFCRPSRLGETVDFFMGEPAACSSGRSCLDVLKWRGRWHSRIILANEPILMLCHGQTSDVFRLRVIIRTPRGFGLPDHILMAEGYFSGRDTDVFVKIDRLAGLKIGNKPAVKFREVFEDEEDYIVPIRAEPVETARRKHYVARRNHYNVV